VRAFHRASLVLNLGLRWWLIGIGISVVLDAVGRAELGSTSGLVYAGTIGVGVSRGLVMGVWTCPDGLRVRNPWTTRSVRWPEIERVVEFWVPQPQPGFGGTVPGLVIHGRRRVVPLYPLVKIGPWTGPFGAYNHFLRDTIRSWQDEFGVTVQAWSPEPPRDARTRHDVRVGRAGEVVPEPRDES
jgi:hypothetical protein